MSREKYVYLRKTLSSKWNDGGWVHQSFNGVPFPALHTRYQIDKAVQKIKTATGLTSFECGKGAGVDMRELIKVNILAAVQKGLLYIDEATATVKQVGSADPELMNVLDSANHHKGMKVTSAGFTFPHGTDHPMAPSNTHEHAHIEGGDGNYDMATLGKPILDGTSHTKPHIPAHDKTTQHCV